MEAPYQVYLLMPFVYCLCAMFAHITSLCDASGVDSVGLTFPFTQMCDRRGIQSSLEGSLPKHCLPLGGDGRGSAWEMLEILGIAWGCLRRASEKRSCKYLNKLFFSVRALRRTKLESDANLCLSSVLHTGYTGWFWGQRHELELVHLVKSSDA
jgi:hypothetical protein